MRSRKPNPLAAHIVHVGKDRRDAAGLAGRFGRPYARIKTLDQNLVDAFVGVKDMDCGSAESSGNLGFVKFGLKKFGLTNFGLTNFGLTNLASTRGHGSLLLALRHFD